MGHDAFFSYARADNAAHGRFIQTFREMLAERVAARLRIKHPELEFVEDKLDFFIDHEGLPAGGLVSEELQKHVGQSEFLFIFVGPGYLQSAYCQKERIWFRAAFSENDNTALRRTFLIFLTADALTASVNGDLGKLRNLIIWKSCADRTKRDRPMPPRLETQDGDLDDNPKLAEILDDIASAYVERYQDAIIQPVAGTRLTAEVRNLAGTGAAQPPLQPGQKPLTVAVGAVTNNLKEFRNQIVETLKNSKSISLDVIEYGELVDERDKVAERLAHSTAFLQVFDYSPVRAERNDPGGGHLEVQRQMLDPGKPTLFWMPPDAAQAVTKESTPKDLEAINQLAAKARHGEPAKAASELLSILGKSRTDPSAMVLVECTETDARVVEIANSVVKQIWNADVAKGMPIYFPMAAWDTLSEDPNYLDKFHGIIVVDRSKQISALFSQVFKIKDELDRRNMEIEQRLFVLPPRDRAKIFNLPFVVFREAGSRLELPQEDREELRRFLMQVKERAERTSVS